MDELLLSKIRLAIIGQLVNAEWVTFGELQREIEATNGNLGSHIAKLVEAGYLKEEKRFEGRRPQSRYRLTRAGRAALLGHVAALQALVDSGPRTSG
jgi:DNA-binding transcriptional ArsR family regulator